MLLLLGCSAPPPLEVEYAGCISHPADIGCVHRNELVLWSESPLTLTLDGEPVNATETPVQGGHRYTLNIPGGSNNIQATAEQRRWSMALADAPEAISGSAEEIRAAMTQESHHQALLASQLARHESDPLKKQEALEATWAQHRAVRDHYRLFRDQSLWVHIQLQERRSIQDGEARLQALLTEHDGPLANMEMRLFREHIQGMARQYTGDYRNALAHFQASLDTAERMDWHVSMAREEVANIIQGAGHHQEALALLSEPSPSDVDRPCQRASRKNDYAWGIMEAIEAGVSDPGPDPVGLLQEAEAELVMCGASQRLRYHTALNLTLALLLARNLDEARAALSSAEVLSDRRPDPWEGLIAGRLALAEGNAETAIAILTTLADSTETLQAPEIAWRARIHLARALADARRDEEAIAVLQQVGQRAQAHSLMVPLQSGRERFLVGQKPAMQLHVALLLEHGRRREAANVARNWHSQLLSTLQQSHLSAASPDAWRIFLDRYETIRRQAEALGARWDVLPGEREELLTRQAALEAEAMALVDEHFSALNRVTPAARRAPEPGELMLLYVELTDGWWGMALGKSIQLAPIGIAPQPVALLEPFAEAIQAAERVTLLPSRMLSEHDLHATSVNGEPLIAQVPVRHALDLAPPTFTAPLSAPLIVADPQGNLPGARQEGAEVAATVPDGKLLSQDAATREAILGALPGSTLFHFAGHGQLDDAPLTGRLLTVSRQLSISDILTLPRPPQQVVLTSCETATTAGRDVASPGIAQAFLLAGAEVAIAATRPIDDALGRTFAEALYSQGLPITDTRFQHAVLATRTAHPESDWAALRMLTP